MADKNAATTAAPAAPTSASPAPVPPRMVLVYSGRWDGPRPGVIVRGPLGTEHGGQTANINVMLDGTTDQSALASFRGRPEGNTIGGVPVFAKGHVFEDEKRPDFWAQWPV